MALASLDKMMAKRTNQSALMAALERDFKKDPVRFFKTVIMPLLPKESKLSFDREGVIQWKSLVGGGMVDGEGQRDESGLPSPACIPSGTGSMAGRQGEGCTIDVTE